MKLNYCYTLAYAVISFLVLSLGFAIVYAALSRSFTQATIGKLEHLNEVAATRRLPPPGPRVQGRPLPGTLRRPRTVLVRSEWDAPLQTTALVVRVTTCPLVGGQRPLLLFFGVGGTLSTVPLLNALSHTTNAWAALALLLLLAFVFASGYSAINALVKAELFPVEIRALGIGLPHALTVAVFGGTAEYLALWCKRAGEESYFYRYVAAAIGVSLLLFWQMPETQRTSRLDADEALQN